MRFERRAYLLLPGEGERPAYDEYVIAHRIRASQMAPELGFAIPRLGQRYPRSSVPAQALALRVQDASPERLVALEDQLFRAMFAELRDISDPEVLRACCRASGVPPEEVDRALEDPRLRERVFAEHGEAIEAGVRGIPTLLLPGKEPLTGALPLEVLRRALAAALGERAEAT